MQVILASASPRRQELLRQIGIDPIVCPADFNEISGTESEAYDVVLANAAGKCRTAVKEHGDTLPVIAADTVVVIDGKILGKPADSKEAAAMLQGLSGKVHKVLTGVAVAYQGKLEQEVCETNVVFRKLTKQEIEAYIATGEPLDKAGAYGIQGKGAVLVEKIDGCYNNVVGLPLTRLHLMLAKLGVKDCACKNDQGAASM